jgi:hypothetical protein
MDAAYWILDLGYPTRIVPEATQRFGETAPKMTRVEYDFPAKGTRLAVKVVWRDGEVRANPPAKVYERSKGVYDEWIAAIQGGPPAPSAFDGHAGGLTEMVLLGCLAIRAGQTLQLDPATGNVTNMQWPEEWITPKYRTGWTL